MNLADDQQVLEAILSLQDRLRSEIDQLGEVVAARVRYEQRRDQLTDLGNNLALKETIEGALSSDEASKNLFWVAFVEVDKFKSINDRFGYPNADQLLQSIARRLEQLKACFPGAVQAFRAHGDEFYLFGTIPVNSDDVLGAVSRQLDNVREQIEKLSIEVSVSAPDTASQSRSTMSCTVSVGWATSVEVMKALAGQGEQSVTARGTLICLEQAVGEAKLLGRNRVVRYTLDLARAKHASLRGDCKECRCKFSFDVEVQNNKVDRHLYCPNCGAEVPRDVSPAATELVVSAPTTEPDDGAMPRGSESATTGRGAHAVRKFTFAFKPGVVRLPPVDVPKKK